MPACRLPVATDCAPVSVAMSMIWEGWRLRAAHATPSDSTSRPSASVLLTSTERPEYMLRMSSGRRECGPTALSAMHRTAVRRRGNPSRTHASNAASTAAAPAMSLFIPGIPVFDLIDKPPVSYTMPLPTQAHGPDAAASASMWSGWWSRTTSAGSSRGRFPDPDQAIEPVLPEFRHAHHIDAAAALFGDPFGALHKRVASQHVGWLVGEVRGQTHTFHRHRKLLQVGERAAAWKEVDPNLALDRVGEGGVGGQRSCDRAHCSEGVARVVERDHDADVALLTAAVDDVGNRPRTGRAVVTRAHFGEHPSRDPRGTSPRPTMLRRVRDPRDHCA